MQTLVVMGSASWVVAMTSDFRVFGASRFAMVAAISTFIGGWTFASWLNANFLSLLFGFRHVEPLWQEQ